LEFVVNNWAWCYGKLAKEHYQDWLSMDLAAAIALELCGYNYRADICSPLRFVHMKPAVQGWHPIPAKWQNTVPYSFTKSGQLTVGNIKQPYLFHYVEKDFIFLYRRNVMQSSRQDLWYKLPHSVIVAIFNHIIDNSE
jgi:hypothetical protein